MRYAAHQHDQSRLDRFLLITTISIAIVAILLLPSVVLLL
jgi:hypothetical protein